MQTNAEAKPLPFDIVKVENEEGSVAFAVFDSAYDRAMFEQRYTQYFLNCPVISFQSADDAFFLGALH